MKMRVTGVAALAMLLLTGAALGAVKVGDKPVIMAKTVDGKDINNKTLEGRIVIVDFWATWCGPCMAEAPHMVTLSKDFAGKGVVIVGVSLDDDVGTMKQVAQQQGFTWPQICDGKGWQSALAKAWGVHGIPHTFILSPAGEVVWDGHPAEIDDPLAKAVAKYPTPPLLRKQAAAALTEALKESEPAKALELALKTPEGVKADAALTTQAKQLAEKLNNVKGREALAANPDAAKLLTALGAKLDSAPPATAPAAGGTEPPSVTTAALVEAKAAEAEKDHAAGREVAAYDKYKWIAAHGKDTPTGQAAADQVKAYESDADFMTKYKQALKEKEANAELWTAQRLEADGKKTEARVKYQLIVDNYGDTKAAATAKTALEKQ